MRVTSPSNASEERSGAGDADRGADAEGDGEAATGPAPV